MKKTLVSASVIIIFVICSSSSCKKEDFHCQEPINVYQSTLTLTFNSPSGVNLYSEINPLYNKDSLKIYDEMGNASPVYSQLYPISTSSPRNWEFTFGPLVDPNTILESFDREVCKNFIIQYKSNETDTIKTCYKSYKIDCGSLFSSLKIFHKGLLLIEKNNTFFAEGTIIKK